MIKRIIFLKSSLRLRKKSLSGLFTKEEIEKEANSIPEYMALPLCKEAMNLIKVQTTPKSEEELMKQFRMVSRIALREGIYPSAFYLILIDNFSKLS